MIDERTGEKHIADVRTQDNLVIEFQHSHIVPEERTSREQFYQNMVWVVDGTRLKRDYPRFLKGRMNTFHNTIFYETDNPRVFKVDLLDWCFPVDWLKSSVPVVFDFRGDGLLEDDEGLRNVLYCLFPQYGRYARVVEFSPKAFVAATTMGKWSSKVKEFISQFKEQDEIEEKEREQLNSQSSRRSSHSFGGMNYFQRRIYLTTKPRRRRRF